MRRFQNSVNGWIVDSNISTLCGNDKLVAVRNGGIIAGMVKLEYAQEFAEELNATDYLAQRYVQGKPITIATA